jgi:hypothetical protein
MPEPVLLTAPCTGTMLRPASEAHTVSAVTTVAAPKPITANRVDAVFRTIHDAAMTTIARLSPPYTVAATR